MPQIKFSNLVTAMKGKAGGSIFSQNKQGAYFRNNRWGGGRKSARWDAAKQRLTIMSNAWRNLSTEQREAWESAAINFPFQNKFKDEYIPSGYQLFMSLNGNLYAQNLPTLSVPGEKRPFPEDIQISGGTPDVPWVTGGTGATFPYLHSNCVEGDPPPEGCPDCYVCSVNCIPDGGSITSAEYLECRAKIGEQYYMFADPECTSDSDCVDAGLAGATPDVACQDGKCVYVGDGLQYWEGLSYVLNISDILYDGGAWSHDTNSQLANFTASFRFTLGPSTLRKLMTTQKEIVLVSSYEGGGKGSSIRIRPQDQQTTRVYVTFAVATTDTASGYGTFVWYQDFNTSEFKSNSVLQYHIDVHNTSRSRICLNNSGFENLQFEYYENIFQGPISDWGAADGSGHNPFPHWETTGPWMGIVYGAGILGAPTDVIYSDIRYFTRRYDDFKYPLSGMLLGSESILITASGDIAPKCSYKACSITDDACNAGRTKCNCAAGVCGPWKHVADKFSNQAPGGNTSIRLTAAVPIYDITVNLDGSCTFTYAEYWLNKMGGSFANNGATFVPLVTASVQATTESGFYLIASVTRAKGNGMSHRNTEYVNMTLLPADVSADWELWEFVKSAITTAPPGTNFFVDFNVIDVTSGATMAKPPSRTRFRFKAGAELSGSVN